MFNMWNHENVRKKFIKKPQRKNKYIPNITARYDVCYISGNPGFLFNCLLEATTHTNKKYVIIFKEDLPGGSWSISEESDQYSANHFFCSVNPEKIIKFNKENKTLTDMELIEIDKSKLLVDNSMYNANYKFYEFVEPVTKWIKTLYEKMKNMENIDVLNFSEVIKITNMNGTNIIKLIDKSKKSVEISSIFINLGQNTFIKNYELGNKKYNMEKEIRTNKHEFFFSDIDMGHDIIIDTGPNSLFLIVQNLSKYFENDKNNLIVIRFRNPNKDISFEEIEEYLNKMTGKNIKILEKVKSITKSVVKHKNLNIIRSKLLSYNIKYYDASTSLMDEIIG